MVVGMSQLIHCNSYIWILERGLFFYGICFLQMKFDGEYVVNMVKIAEGWLLLDNIWFVLFL